jgi:hypothetical protein
MRAARLTILTGLALAAAACATVETPPAPPPAVASSGPPAPIADHDWFYNRDGGQARLVYGLAESDDLRLGLDCSEGAGRVALSAVGGDGVIWRLKKVVFETALGQHEPGHAYLAVIVYQILDSDAFDQ